MRDARTIVSLSRDDLCEAVLLWCEKHKPKLLGTWSVNFIVDIEAQSLRGELTLIDDEYPNRKES